MDLWSEHASGKVWAGGKERKERHTDKIMLVCRIMGGIRDNNFNVFNMI